MPDFFSWQHILIFLVAALVIVGPKDLPRLMHMMGQWAGKARNMASEFKKSFDDMARQEELDKLRVELDSLRKTQINVPGINDPLPDMSLPPIQGVKAPEPRSGEFQVNDAPAHGATPAAAEPPSP